jgi:hypothetical protein
LTSSPTSRSHRIARRCTRAGGESDSELLLRSRISTVVLCPHTSPSAYINHGRGPEANVRVRWSDANAPEPQRLLARGGGGLTEGDRGRGHIDRLRGYEGHTPGRLVSDSIRYVKYCAAVQP